MMNELWKTLQRHGAWEVQHRVASLLAEEKKEYISMHHQGRSAGSGTIISSGRGGVLNKHQKKRRISANSVTSSSPLRKNTSSSRKFFNSRPAFSSMVARCLHRSLYREDILICEWSDQSNDDSLPSQMGQVNDTKKGRHHSSLSKLSKVSSQSSKSQSDDTYNNNNINNGGGEFTQTQNVGGNTIAFFRSHRPKRGLRSKDASGGHDIISSSAPAASPTGEGTMQRSSSSGMTLDGIPVARRRRRRPERACIRLQLDDILHIDIVEDNFNMNNKSVSYDSIANNVPSLGMKGEDIDGKGHHRTNGTHSSNSSGLQTIFLNSSNVRHVRLHTLSFVHVFAVATPEIAKAWLTTIRSCLARNAKFLRLTLQQTLANPLKRLDEHINESYFGGGGSTTSSTTSRGSSGATSLGDAISLDGSVTLNEPPINNGKNREDLEDTRRSHSNSQLSLLAQKIALEKSFMAKIYRCKWSHDNGLKGNHKSSRLILNSRRILPNDTPDQSELMINIREKYITNLLPPRKYSRSSTSSGDDTTMRSKMIREEKNEFRGGKKGDEDHSGGAIGHHQRLNSHDVLSESRYDPSRPLYLQPVLLSAACLDRVLWFAQQLEDGLDLLGKSGEKQHEIEAEIVRFADLVTLLSRIPSTLLRQLTHQDALCFWMKQDFRYTTSRFFEMIQNCSYAIADSLFSPIEIEHLILRFKSSKARMSALFSHLVVPSFFPKQIPSLAHPLHMQAEPLINFALSSGACISPNFVPILLSSNLQRQLVYCARKFAIERTQISLDEIRSRHDPPGITSRLRLRIKLPKILDIYINDFVDKKSLKSLPGKILNLKAKYLLLLLYLTKCVMQGEKVVTQDRETDISKTNSSKEEEKASSSNDELGNIWTVLSHGVQYYLGTVDSKSSSSSHTTTSGTTLTAATSRSVVSTQKNLTYELHVSFTAMQFTPTHRLQKLPASDALFD
eukprot:g2446.t1